MSLYPQIKYYQRSLKEFFCQLCQLFTTSNYIVLTFADYSPQQSELQ